MPCRYPMYGTREKNSGNKPLIHKSRPKNLTEAYELLELPCGKCTSCRLKKSRDWGIRIACEAQYLWEFHNLNSSFITLTYKEAELPPGGSLVPPHLQKFFKRLRGRIAPHPVRYYASGEYGATCVKHHIKDCPECGPIQRPHYHAIMLGFDFPDKHHVACREGNPVYESELLTKTWNKGFHEIGSVSFESAAYVARYVMKKITGERASEHYQRHDWRTDQWYDVEPEFAHMSKNPGIGMPWLGVYHDDVYESDEMPIPGRGVAGKAPKYFDKLAEKWGLYDMETIKNERRDGFAKSLLEGPSLESRAKNEDARIAMLGRQL